MYVELEQMNSFPAGSNPFNHDLYHMGQKIGKNLIIMFKNHPDEDCPYLILVNPETGERYQITFEEDSNKMFKNRLLAEMVNRAKQKEK